MEYCKYIERLTRWLSDDVVINIAVTVLGDVPDFDQAVHVTRHQPQVVTVTGHDDTANCHIYKDNSVQHEKD